MTDGEQTALQQFEEKQDELNEALLEAYAAGYAQAIGDHEIAEPHFEAADFRELKQAEYIQKQHYYFWDGRTKPLALWLPEQFGLGDEEVK
jgi:hypothetical protein